MDPQQLLEALARLTEAGLVAPATDDVDALHAWAVAEAGARHANVDRDRIDDVIRLLIVVRDGDEAQQAKAKAALAKRAAAAATTDDATDDAAAAAGDKVVPVTRKGDAARKTGTKVAKVAEAGACVACKHTHSETAGGACDEKDCDCKFRMKEAPPAADHRALREGALSFQEIERALSAALRSRLPAGSKQQYAYPRAIWNDTVAYEIESPEGTETYRCTYMISADGEVTLGDAEKVRPETSYVKVAEAFTTDAPTILEAISTDPRKGKVFDVLLIAAGTSANRRRYRPEVLKAAVPLFEGVRAFAGAGPDHSPQERGTRSLVGWYTDARYVTGIKTPSAVREGVAAHFHVSKAAAWLSDLIEDGLDRGKSDLVGFSLVGDGAQTPVREAKGRQPILDVDPITIIDSVDVVTNPAAGGIPLRLVASKENPLMEWSTLTLVEAVKRLASGAILPQELSEHRPDLAASLAEGRFAEASPAAPASGVTAPADGADIPALIEAALAPMRTAQLVEAKLAARKGLPAAVAARLREAFTGKTLDEAGIDEGIQREVDYLASISPATIRESGLAIVTDMKSERDRVVEAMYDILSSKSQASIKEMYVDLTGDRAFTGRVQESGRLSESISSTTFAEITLDAMNKRVLDNYAVPGLDTWREIVDIVPLNDLKTQHRIRYGGYGNLPAISEGNEYLPLTSPGDEQATYAPIKRGGTEDLTIEMILNDDVKAMRDIPRRLGRAAAQTLHEFVFDFLRTNAVVYDGLALAHVNHGNLGTSALATAAVTAARQRMLKQTDMSSSKRLAIRPKKLIIPIDLEEQAFGLLNADKVLGSNNNDPNFVKKFGLDLIVVEYWTDANDWWLTADKASAPGIEIGFVQGREEPEVFLQDEPTVGRVFSHDKLTYKIRHWYGGVVLDARAFQGNLVA